MAGKISLKTTVAVFLFFGVVLILSACLDPVDFNAFINNEEVESIIETAKTGGGGSGGSGTNVVKVDDKTGDGLKGVNGKITGLKPDRYYMVEKELDKDGEPVFQSNYPAFVTDLAGVGPGGLNGLDSITRIKDGTINGWHNTDGSFSLNNNHTYTVRAAAPFFDGTAFHYSDSGAPADQTVQVENGAIEIFAPKGYFTLEKLNTSFKGYDVMGVAVSPASAPADFSGGKKSISDTVTSFKLEGKNTEVDYIFYKPGAPDNFIVLKVKIGDVPPTVITDKAIQGVTAPVVKGMPAASVTNTAQYTGTVAWDKPSTLVDGKFGPLTEYTATITLTAKSGYTFTGVAANFFTVTGATTVSNLAGSGSSCVVTATFPTTEAWIIDIKDIEGVTKPVALATGATNITPTAQYTGAVSWAPALIGGKFDYSTAYTATITLTATGPDYTFTGVGADFFAVAGATTVGNPAGSGSSCVVTAEFPKTGDEPAPGTGTAEFTITFTINDAMDGKFTANNSATIDRGTFNGDNKVVITLAAPASGSWSGIKWYVGGAEDTTHVSGNALTIDNSSAFWPVLAQTNFEVSVTATLNGAPYSGTVTIYVTGP